MWITVIISILVACGLLLLIEPVERRRMKRARTKLLAQSPRVSDNDFLMSLALADSHAEQVALGIRRMISEELSLPGAVIGSDTRFHDLFATAWDGGDTVMFTMHLEKIFGIEIPDEDAKKIVTVKELVQYVLQSERTRKART
jgi:acyl carrier protein